MRRYLLASTAILAIAAPAAAEDVGNARTTPLQTSTIANGSPGTIKITANGAVTVTSGTAVTMDTNHAVTNQGAIKVTSTLDNTAGIVANAGTSGDIVNSGTITIDEPYTPTDSDNDGDLDGPFALATNRFGIHALGAHTGKVEHSGTITVEGNNSAGIQLDGPLNGTLVHNGTTTVTGNNSAGVKTGAIAGPVRLAGAITVRGEGSVGAQIGGDVTGAMVVQGGISSSGYRYTTAPSNTSKLDADDLLQGGSALLIEGNVTGGIVLAIAPADADPNNPDEDADGLPDATEGSARVTSIGSAPAMVIGAVGRDIAIGPVAAGSTHFGLQIDGVVQGVGLYAGFDGNGLQIGGRGGAVTIANGMSVAGTVSATSAGSNATALRFGAGASTPELRISGAVDASGSNLATATATAIRLDAGASLPTIRNSGTIRAAATGDAGSATAVAIQDASGTLTLVENSGKITASGAAATSNRNIAIDVSANTSGVTVRQTLVAANFTAPSITGDIRFGSGADLLDLADGTMTGNITFGDGADKMQLSGDAVHSGKAYFGAGNDILSLAGTSVFNGLADFGGGADTLTIANTSRFKASIANAGGLAVNLTGGILDVSGTAAIGSLNVGATGVLIATLDKDAGEGTFYNIGGTAAFADGATLALRLGDVENAEGRYLVLQAGTLQGASNIDLSDALIPFLFKASLATDAGPNAIAVNIARRTATELGLNASQASAYNAVISAISEDEDLEDVFLGLTTGDMFRNSLQQMLPDHAGGTFEGISLGSRTLARQVAEPIGPVYSWGGVDVIMNAATWTSEKDLGDTAAYDLEGLGFSAAAEVDLNGFGSVGLAGSWLWNSHDQGNSFTNVQSDTYEIAAYWRGQWGGFTGFARGSYGFANFKGRRTFQAKVGTETVTRESTGEWDGKVTTMTGGASYEFSGGGFFARPGVTVDYVKLTEDGYSDTGGGEAFDLIVDERTSDELAVNGGLTLGIDFSGTHPADSYWFRVEGDGGWREVVAGELGATTAHFEDGTAFTLNPEPQASGWFARLRAVGGSDVFEFGGEIGAEERHDNTALTLRGTLRLGF